MASIFNGNLQYRHLSRMWSFKTLETDKYMPKKIANTTIKVEYPKNDLGKLTTTIKWEPAEGKQFSLSCRKSYFIDR